jgi:hypothetical protein
MRRSRIVYAMDVGGVQNVAREELGRALTNRELKIFEDEIGDVVEDAIDWREAFAFVIARNFAK